MRFHVIQGGRAAEPVLLGAEGRQHELLVIERATMYGSRRAVGPRVRVGLRVGLAVAAALLVGGVDFFGWRAMLSGAHTDADIARTVIAVSEAIDLLREDGLVR